MSLHINFSRSLSLLAGTVRFLLTHTTGDGTCLSFNNFRDEELKRTGLSLTYIGHLQLLEPHWRNPVDNNTAVLIFDVPVAASDSFPKVLFETLADLGKVAKEKPEEVRRSTERYDS